VYAAAENEQQLALCDHPLYRSSYTVWFENKCVKSYPFPWSRFRRSCSDHVCHYI